MQTPQHNDQMDADDVTAIDELGEVYGELKSTLHKIIIGQEQVIENLAICLFSQGHALLMGVPGLAKTLLVSCFADTMALSFRRIQFTPDLMPMDITGTDILQEIPGGKREFEFVKGPLFANLILADEINRAPSKTQAAMLEAMQEHKITVIGRTYQLDPPFFVLATQNPIEQEGTYPLPEAQLDRFMFRIEVDYPDRVEEIEIARTTTGMSLPTLDHVITGEQVLAFQNLVRRVPVPEHIFEFAVDLARSTRPKGDAAPEWLRPLVAWGAGPRAVQYLILGAKARAALSGSYMARLEDIVAVANPVLGHRVITSFAAESENITSGDIVDRLVEELSEN